MCRSSMCVCLCFISGLRAQYIFICRQIMCVYMYVFKHVPYIRKYATVRDCISIPAYIRANALNINHPGNPFFNLKKENTSLRPFHHVTFQPSKAKYTYAYQLSRDDQFNNRIFLSRSFQKTRTHRVTRTFPLQSFLLY